jgi:hypothetical protein
MPSELALVRWPDQLANPSRVISAAKSERVDEQVKALTRQTRWRCP